MDGMKKGSIKKECWPNKPKEIERLEERVQTLTGCYLSCIDSSFFTREFYKSYYGNKN